MFPENKKLNKDKVLEKEKKKLEKQQPKFVIKKQMKRRIKNSQTFSNVKSVADDGLIELKTGEVASLIEVKAIDLSLTSKSEKNNFFYALKSLYQIRNLNLKCYKLDQKINLNNNKINSEELEENHFTWRFKLYIFYCWRYTNKIW